MTNKLTIEQFSKLVGSTTDKLGYECIKLFNTLDMTYRIIEGEEEKQLIFDILKKIDGDTQIIGAPERTDVWFKGWEENLNDFRNNKDDESVTPKFIRPNKVIRLDGKYIEPSNPYFERDYAKLLQLYIYHNFISKDIDNVYEFGCGSGFNLLNLSEFRKDLNLYGSDFVKSSADLINELGKHHDLNMKGDVFDMIYPDYNYDIKENSCVFTHGAIEQLAGKFEDFINYLLEKKPKICFHIEPTVEFYTNDTIFDYLATKFHRKRGYTEGLVPYLKKLESNKKIKIDVCHRFNFGSMFMEGYNLVVWRCVD